MVRSFFVLLGLSSILNLNIRWTKELDDVKITLRFMNVTKQCSDSAGIREEDDRDVI